MAQEKDKKAKDVGEASSKPVSSKAGTQKALKPKAKIVKKSPHTNPMKNNNPKGTPQVQGEKKKRWKKKKKIVSEGNKETRIIVREDDKNLNSGEKKQKSIADKEDKDNIQRNSKSKEKPSGFQKKQKSEKKKEKGSGFETRRNQMYKEKCAAELEKNNKKQKEKNNEKLGGLIFMCNARTKPDCFHYQVMGVPLSKKDLVLRIRPGLKLFLYDFDLRIMYGIYKAASSGGVGLEPTAFAGAFPVQVRFVVDQDCYPVAESVFKRAIRENYDSPSKFRTDLTPKQVKRLIELFRPVDIPSNTPAVVPQQMVMVQHGYPMLPQENGQHLPYSEGPTEQEDAYLTEKEYRAYGLRRERPNLTPPQARLAPTLEPYPPRIQVVEQSLRYPPALYREIAPSSVDPTPPATLIEHPMRHPSTIYREIGPPTGEPARHDPLLLSEREYQTYGLGARQDLQYSSVPPSTGPTTSTLDTYRYHHYPSYYATSAADPHPPPSSRIEVPSEYYPGARREAYPVEAADRLPRRETYQIETLPRRETYLTETGGYVSSRGGYVAESDSLKRREHDDSERLYSARASSALSDYNRAHNYQGAQPEASSFTTSVSARYSFAGPSSYR